MSESTPAINAQPGQVSPPGQSIPELSQEQQTMVGWLQDCHATGRMNDAELDTALHQVTGRGREQLTDDTRTPEQKSFDRDFPAAKPHEYLLPSPEDPTRITPEEKALNQAAREWLAAGRFTREHGSSLAKEVANVAQKLEHFTDAQHEEYQQTEMAALSRVWGANTQKNLAITKAFVQELGAKHPQLIEMLNATGAGNSSRVIVQIFHQAERLMVRNRQR